MYVLNFVFVSLNNTDCPAPSAPMHTWISIALLAPRPWPCPAALAGFSAPSALAAAFTPLPLAFAAFRALPLAVPDLAVPALGVPAFGVPALAVPPELGGGELQ